MQLKLKSINSNPIYKRKPDNNWLSTMIPARCHHWITSLSSLWCHFGENLSVATPNGINKWVLFILEGKPVHRIPWRIRTQMDAILEWNITLISNQTKYLLFHSYLLFDLHVHLSKIHLSYSYYCCPEKYWLSND